MSDSNFLAPPSLNITRQIATGVLGSPITLSREVSTTSSRSEPRHPDEVMRERLLTYKTQLEHDVEFVNNEIQALIVRTPSQDPVQEAAWLKLRDDLKIRFNTLSARLSRLNLLLEVM